MFVTETVWWTKEEMSPPAHQTIKMYININEENLVISGYYSVGRYNMSVHTTEPFKQDITDKVMLWANITNLDQLNDQFNKKKGLLDA